MDTDLPVPVEIKISVEPKLYEQMTGRAEALGHESVEQYLLSLVERDTRGPDMLSDP